MTLDSCVSPLSGFESLRIFLERADALNDASAVPKDREDQLAGFADVVRAAADGGLPGRRISLRFQW